MAVTIIDIPARELESSRILISFDEKFAVEIEGLGISEYRWRVFEQSCGYDPMLTFTERFEGAFKDGWLDGQKTLGLIGVYLEPKTFAHVVNDLLANA